MRDENARDKDMEPKLKRRGEKTDEPSPVECLQSIVPVKKDSRFLISWNPEETTLTFGCGDGKVGVLVSSNKELERSPFSIPTRLTPECVANFRSSSSEISGMELLNRCQTLLHSYVHFEDERLYSLI